MHVDRAYYPPRSGEEGAEFTESQASGQLSRQLSQGILDDLYFGQNIQFPFRKNFGKLNRLS